MTLAEITAARALLERDAEQCSTCTPNTYCQPHAELVAARFAANRKAREENR